MRVGHIGKPKAFRKECGQAAFDSQAALTEAHSTKLTFVCYSRCFFEDRISAPYCRKNGSRVVKTLCTNLQLHQLLLVFAAAASKSPKSNRTALGRRWISSLVIE